MGAVLHATRSWTSSRSCVLRMLRAAWWLLWPQLIQSLPKTNVGLTRLEQEELTFMKSLLYGKLYYSIYSSIAGVWHLIPAQLRLLKARDGR